MSEELNPLRILVCGLEPKVAQIIEECCVGSEFTRIDSVELFAHEFEQWQDDSFDAVFCGPSLEGISGTELAQVFKSQCPSILKYFVTINTDRFEPRVLVKNGFNGAFLLPLDLQVLKKAIVEKLISRNHHERSFRSVRIVDLDSSDPLQFDTFLFLPKNNKYIRYTGAHQPVEKNRLDKLEKRSMNSLWIDHRDMNKFYQHTAKKLRELGEGALSSTEKQERLKTSVRTIFSDIFDTSVKADFAHGREMVRQCENIISNYITKGVSSNWYRKLMTSIGEESDSYNHSSTVSTFAALFAIGLNHRHPEDLAMAGLFHDLGINQLPDEIQKKSPEELSDLEKEIYYSHAERSVTMIKNKRIIIPDSVERAILQHHECWNGSGWPRKLVAGRISEDAQILSFADQFDYLTRIAAGKTRLTPIQAFFQIRQTGTISPELLMRIRRLLEKEVNAVKGSA